jgi:chaperonin GroEL (HSP60 family)
MHTVTHRGRRTISAHNDETIGGLVARAIEKVGAEGAVTVEEAKGTGTTMRFVASVSARSSRASCP